jgi:HEAT repeat protein
MLWASAQTPGVARAEPLVAGPGTLDGRENSTHSFATRFGMEAERRALDLGGQPRLRALQRLLPLSHRLPRQVAELVDRWLSTEPKLSPPETWALLRPLAELGGEPRIRQYLSKVLAAEALVVETNQPYAAMITAAAALSLAKHRTPESAALLAEWLRRPSERAAAVQQALLTHPPQNISLLVDASGPPTPLLLETLGELGNPAAVPYLRQVVKRATAEVQAAAAIALAKLGLSETQDLATLWLRRSDSPPALLQASAFILLRFGHPERTEAFARLARTNPSLALTVAEEFPPDDSLLALGEHVGELSKGNERKRAVRVLARMGAKAVSLLVALMRKDTELRWEIASALGDGGTTRTAAALGPLLSSAETRAAALSALVVLSVRHPQQAPHTLVAELTRASQSSDALERSVGKSGLALIDETHARRYLVSNELDELTAAALAAGVHGPEYLRAGLLELERRAQTPSASGAKVTPQVLALSSLLSFVSPREVVSSRLLRALANSSYPIAATARWHSWVRSGNESGFGFTPDVWPAPRVQAADVPGGRWSDEQSKDTFTLLDSVSKEIDYELRAAMAKALRSRSNLRIVSETLDWLANYDPHPLVRKMAAAKVTDESVLRPLWVSPPSTETPVGYWVTVEAADRTPTALYLTHGVNAFFFIRAPADAAVIEGGDGRLINGQKMDPSDPSNESSAIPLRVEALLHPVHNSR